MQMKCNKCDSSKDTFNVGKPHTLVAVCPVEGAMPLVSDRQDCRRLAWEPVCFSFYLQSQGSAAHVTAWGELVKLEMWVIMKKLNCSIVGVLSLMCTYTKTFIGWHLLLNVP